MNLLILGSEGFIGSHCVDHFQAKNHQVWGLDLFEQPSRNYSYIKVSRLSPEFEEIFQTQPFDVIINAAGSGNVSYSMTHPLSDFEANCLDTIRVLDAIRKYQTGSRYIHLSSAAVYGNPTRLPIKEEDVTVPLSAYGWHKLMSEQLCHEYAKLYQVHTAILRPFSVYGPRLKKQLFWDLYNKIQHANGNMIELYGTGKESRDFVHVTDLVKAIDCVIAKGQMEGEVYNLAAGVETRIEEVVALYFEEFPVEIKYKFNGMVREGDPINWRAETSRLSALGFMPETDLQAGLSDLVKWLRQLS